MIRSINPKIKLAGIKKLKKKINEEGEKILDEFSKSEDMFCVILDQWQNVIGESIYNIACKNSNEITFIESIRCKEKETAENIAKMIELTLEKNNIPIKRVVGICTDNNITMRSVGKVLQTTNNIIISSGCISHILNIISKKIIQIDKYKSIFDYCTRITHQINHSKTIRLVIFNKLKRFLRIDKGSETRWSSVSKMFKGILDNQLTLSEINLLDKSKIPLIDELYKILNYLCGKIHILSRDDASLSDAYHVYTSLKKDLSNYSNEKEIKLIIEKEKKLINRNILILSEYLEINSKTKFSEQQKNDIKMYIITEFSNVTNDDLGTELYYFENRLDRKSVV